MTIVQQYSLFHNLKKLVLFQRPEMNSQLPKSNTIICSCQWVVTCHRSKMVPRKDSYFVLSTKKGWGVSGTNLLGVLSSGTGIILPKKYCHTKGHPVKSSISIDVHYWMEMLKVSNPQQQTPLKE